MITPFEKLLPALENVIDRGDGKWMARCPSHDDHSPSLAIQEKSDGELLIHCFAACSPSDVLAALNLSLADLFPGNSSTAGTVRPRWNVKDLLVALSIEFHIVLIAANDIVSGKSLTEADIDRVADAMRRVQRIQEICNV